MYLISKIRSFLGRGLLAWRRYLYARLQRKGQMVEVSLPDRDPVWLYPAGQIAELLFTRRFERLELALMVKFLKPGMGVLDIGANIGLYSIIATKLVGPEGTVIAIEPSGESYKRLQANLAFNNITSVDVVKKGLADSVYPDMLIKRDPGYRDGDRYLATRKIENAQVAQNQEDAGDGELVPVTSLDHYLYIERKSCPTIHFLKMDIEGGEYAVFRGAERFLSENQQAVIMFECTPQGCRCSGCTQEEIFDLLRDAGFGVYAWIPERNAWVSDYDSVKLAGNVWACRDMRVLPTL